MEEIWKFIKHYGKRYQVSNLGRVRSLYKNHIHLMTPFINNQGYKMVHLSYISIRKQVLIHRLVAYAFCPNPYHYKVVNHKDENKLNNKASNLEWCSTSYNNMYGNNMLRSSLTSFIKNMNQYSNLIKKALPSDFKYLKKMYNLSTKLNYIKQKSDDKN